jgi:integrase
MSRRVTRGHRCRERPIPLFKLPDDELVAHVWACRLKQLADLRGAAPTDITLEMALSVVEPTLGMDTTNVAMAGIEKVLKAIASGNVTVAAKMIRELLLGGAANVGMRNQIATARRKQSERADRIRLMLDACPHHTMIGIRDRALPARGFAGALRRSELVALQVSDLEEVPDGYRLTIRRSKTDQTGEGAEIVIPPRPPDPARGCGPGVATGRLYR